MVWGIGFPREGKMKMGVPLRGFEKEGGEKGY